MGGRPRSAQLRPRLRPALLSRRQRLFRAAAPEARGLPDAQHLGTRTRRWRAGDRLDPRRRAAIWLQRQPDVRRRRICEARYHLRVDQLRSEEHTSELQSLMRISYAVFCLKKKKKKHTKSQDI